jgi:purine-binding chemotaxis protein CheW
MLQNSLTQLVIFFISSQRFALPLDVVERVVSTESVRHLPLDQSSKHDLINVLGSVLPQISIHKSFGLEKRKVNALGELILVKTRNNQFAIKVDFVSGVEECNVSSTRNSKNIAKDASIVEGVRELKNGTIFIFDADLLFSVQQKELSTEELSLAIERIRYRSEQARSRIQKSIAKRDVC